MRINGFQKTTLLDYPEKLAATVFLGGCNFCCPFCHNSSLVLPELTSVSISEEEVLTTLHKRKNILEGVCITGGEPTISKDLKAFLSKIKDLGLLVKLDTNGSNPKMLKELVFGGFIDYIAMDVKNSKNKYNISVGLNTFNISLISESIEFLLSGCVDYEFRTTVVKELHNREDLLSIGAWIQGAKAFYLQAYEDSEDVISPGFSSYTKTELLEFCNLLQPYAQTVKLRGID